MNKMFKFTPVGVCSKEMEFEISQGKVVNLKIHKGCSGNLHGITRLVEGMDAKEVIKKLKGIPCRGTTSCPDQLAIAIEKALETQA